MLGRVVPLDAFDEASGCGESFGGSKGLVEASRAVRGAVRVQVVLHQNKSVGIWVERVTHPLERAGVVQARAPLFDLHPPLGRQRFKDKEQRAGAAKSRCRAARMGCQSEAALPAKEATPRVWCKSFFPMHLQSFGLAR